MSKSVIEIFPLLFTSTLSIFTALVVSVIPASTTTFESAKLPVNVELLAVKCIVSFAGVLKFKTVPKSVELSEFTSTTALPLPVIVFDIAWDSSSVKSPDTVKVSKINY